MNDVVIIGAGVVGCAVARELSSFNLRVKTIVKSNLAL
ncbi:MAG: NAD-binding protein [Candidatus Cloacimonetes bacterium]|nr:NAD-binding protein [Candidatus Cloacimonadota bacterium]